jgi:hypothetical protein
MYYTYIYIRYMKINGSLGRDVDNVSETVKWQLLATTDAQILFCRNKIYLQDVKTNIIFL